MMWKFCLFLYIIEQYDWNQTWPAGTESLFSSVALQELLNFVDFSLILKLMFKLLLSFRATFIKTKGFSSHCGGCMVWYKQVQTKLSPPCPAAEPLSQSVSADKTLQIRPALGFPEMLQEGNLHNTEHG